MKANIHLTGISNFGQCSGFPIRVALLILALGTIALGAAETVTRLRTVVGQVGAASASSRAGIESALPNYKCSGLVIDAAGKGIPGAVVEVYQYGISGPARGQQMQMKSRVVADNEGAFQVELGGGVA